MTFEEAMPVEVEVVPEIDDAPIVDDVEPIGSSEQEDEPVVENTNPAAVSVFNFENYNVRTVVDENGAVWFVAKDVALSLGYVDAANAIKQHCDDGVVFHHPIQDSMNRTQKVRVIDESDVYALIFGSKLESSKRFKKWVTSEVLPTIRKTGKYEAPNKKIDICSPEVIATLRKVRTVQLAMGMSKVQSSQYARDVIKRKFGADMVREVIGDYIQLTFVEATPVEVEVVPEIDDAPIVVDVEPEVVVDEPVVDEPAPEVFEIEIYAKPIGSDEVNTVNARELWAKLESKRQFTDWIKQRIEQYDFVEGVDYLIHKFVNNPETGGRPTIDYFISLDMAKELSMVENNVQGKLARRYFIECEKIAKGETPKVETVKDDYYLGLNKERAELILANEAKALAVKSVPNHHTVRISEKVSLNKQSSVNNHPRNLSR